MHSVAPTDTRRLYEEDSSSLFFTATVLDCVPRGLLFAVALDRTSFFPEGGGQAGDRGLLSGVPVSDTVSEGGVIRHLCERSFEAGQTVSGAVDGAKRRLDRQIHSAEHLLSGLILRRFGAQNLAFHIGSACPTADFNRFFTTEELALIEKDVNRAIVENRAVRAFYPASDLLASLSLRKRPEVDGPMRVVEIEGVDSCGCCGTHVASTGEIGLFKLLSGDRYKSGSRISFLCGDLILPDYAFKHNLVSELAKRFSCSPQALPSALDKRLAETASLKQQLADRTKLLADSLAESLLSHAENGKIEVELPFRDPVLLSELASALAAREGVWCFLRAGEDYVLAANESASADLAAFHAELIKKGARGGGKGLFYRGRLSGR